MEFKKTANYNIRFADTISMDPMDPLTIDLTPAEVIESAGKVMYILRTIGDNTCDFGVCVGYNITGKTITFMVGGDDDLLTLEAANDNDFYQEAGGPIG